MSQVKKTPLHKAILRAKQEKEDKPLSGRRKKCPPPVFEDDGDVSTLVGHVGDMGRSIDDRARLREEELEQRAEDRRLEREERRQDRMMMHMMLLRMMGTRAPPVAPPVGAAAGQPMDGELHLRPHPSYNFRSAALRKYYCANYAQGIYVT